MADTYELLISFRSKEQMDGFIGGFASCLSVIQKERKGNRDFDRSIEWLEGALFQLEIQYAAKAGGAA